MNEAQVGFLYNAATVVSKGQNDNIHNILKSYYLLKCKATTKGYGLPQQQFSNKSRCSYCFIEWNNNFDSRVTPLKLSKKQRRRIRDHNKKRPQKRQEIIEGNKFEQICRFCKHITTTYITKPDKKVYKNKIIENNMINSKKRDQKEIIKSNSLQTNTIDVYCKSREAFSLKSNKNTLQNVVKESKIIKNNKKKKDKFAGLCQKAVLSAAKLKNNQDKKDIMKLFLKPSQ